MDIIVEAKTGKDTIGKLTIGDKVFDCALGKGGITDEANKVEGDSKTPSGTYSLRYLLWRRDKNPRPETRLEVKEISENLGWCDDVNDPKYNRLVALPYAASHEKIWREDDLYDYVVVLGHNDNPPIAGKGSAIFMHVARNEFTPTAGCVGLKKEDLLEVLKNLDGNSKIIIKMPKI